MNSSERAYRGAYAVKITFVFIDVDYWRDGAPCGSIRGNKGYCGSWADQPAKLASLAAFPVDGQAGTLSIKHLADFQNSIFFFFIPFHKEVTLPLKDIG